MPKASSNESIYSPALIRFDYYFIQGAAAQIRPQGIFMLLRSLLFTFNYILAAPCQTDIAHSDFAGKKSQFLWALYIKLDLALLGSYCPE